MLYKTIYTFKDSFIRTIFNKYIMTEMRLEDAIDQLQEDNIMNKFQAENYKTYFKL